MTMQSLQNEIDTACFERRCEFDKAMRAARFYTNIAEAITGILSGMLVALVLLIAARYCYGVSAFTALHQAIGVAHYVTAVFFISLTMWCQGYWMWRTYYWHAIGHIMREEIEYYLHISWRKIGGLYYVKIHRACFSFCVTRRYKPL